MTTPSPTPEEIEAAAWSSMETAPKDGSYVLVYNPVTGPYSARYTDGEWPLHNWDGMEGIWYPVPYCWRPLPEPPDDFKTAARRGRS
jgi:hypothetical protein